MESVRMRGILFISVVLSTALLCFAWLHADDKAADAELDKNDPLYKALKQLEREAAELRAKRGGMKSSQGMSPIAPAPSMTPKAVTAPARNNVSQSQSADVMPAPPRETTTDLWSFQPLTSPPLPALRDTAWGRDDLDRFILARLEAKNVRPNPDASRHALLRRVAFDLTGLPPTLDEIQSFTSDSAPLEKALAKVVDRYLASPRFGERWGRHWLDVVRYADSVGQSWNAPFTYAWRYRDYVIDAFNNDKPYHRFIAEQLAGDLLPAADDQRRREQLTATGFLAIGSLALTGKSAEQFVMDQVDDQIDATTRAFLGLTISCARCHDHKFDPVSMRDYYALAGIFYSTLTLTGQGYSGNLGRNGYVDPEMLLQLPGREPNPKIGQGESGPIVHSMSDYQELWSQGNRRILFTTDPNLASGALEGEVRDCPVRYQGEAFDRGPAPPRGDLRLPSLPRLPQISTGSSGRLELARWIATRDNPLTSRVMANRIWQHLFGRGIVRTVDEFGNSGESPTHPELLDHLATRFSGDWSVKKLIRAIVLSRTYRLSSAGSTAAERDDAQNELYWRMNLRRLELEPLRDAMLLAAGRLEFERPDKIAIAGTGGKSQLSQVHSLLRLDSPYRTVYLPVLRSLLPDVYGTFDFPDPSQIQGQREVTTVPPQALFFMNSGFAADCAADAAKQLIAEPARDESQRVRKAYLQLLSREPKPAELRDSLALLAALQPPAGERDSAAYRWATFVQALMASAEFRYVK